MIFVAVMPGADFKQLSSTSFTVFDPVPGGVGPPWSAARTASPCVQAPSAPCRKAANAPSERCPTAQFDRNLRSPNAPPKTAEKSK